MCGVLFGLCSLTNLTALSLVCCLKVCFHNHGEGISNQTDEHDVANTRDVITKLNSMRKTVTTITAKHLFVFSLWSGNKFSSSHARLLVAGVWCYASVFAVGPLAQWGHYSPEPYGTACCIDWHAPNHELSALSYIVCLFIFCYALPCTVIFLSYTFILLTVRGSRQAVQQHVSPQTKTANAHTLIVKVRGYECVASASLTSCFCTCQDLSRILDIKLLRLDYMITCFIFNLPMHMQVSVNMNKRMVPQMLIYIIYVWYSVSGVKLNASSAWLVFVCMCLSLYVWMVLHSSQ